ncbi:MAG TPA: phosphoglycerate dehydrogenase [Ignavibacteria bacterium]|nr:phosphoglycerate dehydrogenase [Ignavibacteria bacterium]
MSKNLNKYFIIDFDSTFIKVEAIDELAKISLRKDKDRNIKFERIKSLTSKAMNGKISFNKSLTERLKLLTANKAHIEILIKILKKSISNSILNNKPFFRTYGNRIIILSGGFKEYITPIVSKFGIKECNVYANEFIFNKKGIITGFNKKNILSSENGKSKLLKKLNLKGDLIVIGDGHTDYEIKQSGLAHKFYAFTENVSRNPVLKKADHVAPSFDEFLYVSKLPMSISFPKNRIKVLLLENIHKDAVSNLKSEGFNVEIINKSLSEGEISEKIKDVFILGIRSKTKVTEKVLQNANKLLAIGAFCIGTNQIDIKSCSERGVIVFNAPFSNTRSVVELAIGEIIMLMRGIFDKSNKLQRGEWDKSSAGSLEVRGKKLGIIGYGKIGSQLSVLAESLGMEVYFYDLVEKLALGNAKKCNSLKEILAKSDVISVHVDGNEKNFNLIGEREFALMKNGAIYLNLSRGFVTDIKALSKYLKTGKIKGAAIDVFPEEPESNSDSFKNPLKGFDNVILTPHIGGSTDEAQKDIASFVTARITDFINSGNSNYSINFPEIQLPSLQNAHRLIHIHRNVPGILARINEVFAEHNINIIGQYLKTNEDIGYVITDISRKYNPELISELKKIPYTIKFRILY